MKLLFVSIVIFLLLNPSSISAQQIEEGFYFSIGVRNHESNTFKFNFRKRHFHFDSDPELRFGYNIPKSNFAIELRAVENLHAYSHYSSRIPFSGINNSYSISVQEINLIYNFGKNSHFKSYISAGFGQKRFYYSTVYFSPNVIWKYYWIPISYGVNWENFNLEFSKYIRITPTLAVTEGYLYAVSLNRTFSISKSEQSYTETKKIGISPIIEISLAANQDYFEISKDFFRRHRLFSGFGLQLEFKNFRTLIRRNFWLQFGGGATGGVIIGNVSQFSAELYYNIPGTKRLWMGTGFVFIKDANKFLRTGDNNDISNANPKFTTKGFSVSMLWDLNHKSSVFAQSIITPLEEKKFSTYNLSIGMRHRLRS